MSLVHDPFTNMRLFEDAVTRMMSEPRTARPWSPPVDIFETEDALVLKADLPDVNPEDIEVQVENQTLTIRGQRKFEQQADKGGFHRIERSYGTFVRTFTVPTTVDTEKVQADYKNGVLTITLPKKEAAKPRQVKIGVNASQGQPAKVSQGAQQGENQGTTRSAGQSS
jgi:HSP20 family protein